MLGVVTALAGGTVVRVWPILAEVYVSCRVEVAICDSGAKVSGLNVEGRMYASDRDAVWLLRT